MTAVLPVLADQMRRREVSSDAPIGIFDSGVGGLSIALEIIRHLPNERIVYYADTAHVPYGPRQDDDIRRLTADAIAWLYERGCKMAVVACNTASAFSLDYLRAYYGEGFAIVGLVPALKPALLQTKSKVVAVLATPATFRGKLIQEVRQNFAVPAHINVLELTCLELVPLIEAGQMSGAETEFYLKQTLQHAIDAKADYLVLGCTHYPFLKSAITAIFADQLQCVDSGLAVARQTAHILIKNKLLFEGKRADDRQIECFLSGNNAFQLEPVIQHLLDSCVSWSIHDIKPQRSF